MFFKSVYFKLRLAFEMQRLVLVAFLEHGLLFETGRVIYAAITDQEAVNAFQLLSQQEGIIPALESSHAIAYTIQLAQEMQPEQIIIVNLSGRGDKDLNTVKKYLAGATA